MPKYLISRYYETVIEADDYTAAHDQSDDMTTDEFDLVGFDIEETV